MPSSPGKIQPEYSDSFRAVALARLFSEGYPEFPGALRKVSAVLGISHQTLARWAKGIGASPVPTDLVRMAVDVMEQSINAELEKILAAMDAKRDDAAFKELVIGFGILFDKAQSLRGAPTKRVAVSHTINDLRERSNEELERIIAEAEQHARDAVDDAIDVTPREVSELGSGSGDGEADSRPTENPGLHQLHLPEVHS